MRLAIHQPRQPPAKVIRKGAVLSAEMEVGAESSGTKAVTDLIGPPLPEAIDLRALDPAMGRVLWEMSTLLTKVSWPYI